MAYISGIVVGTTTFFLVVYFFLSQHRTPQALNVSPNTSEFPQELAQATSLTAASGTTLLASSIPASVRKYQNGQYGFSLLYPKDLKIAVFDDGGGASTITFQNTAEVKGFQIFVVPYREKQVSMERFHEDEPTGVMLHPTVILVGGSKATMFFSTSQTLGDTIEVWVIKNGYLFEITAPKLLDIWLANIIQTWSFSQ